MGSMDNNDIAMRNLDLYLEDLPDSQANIRIVNQLKKLQSIASGFKYGDLLYLGREEIVRVIESSGAIFGEAVYRMICLVRHYAEWAYSRGIISGHNGIPDHPIMYVELNDIHVSNAYKYHLIRDLDELLRIIYSFWVPGSGQYTPVIMSLCWIGIPYRVCTKIKSDQVFLTDELYVLYCGKRFNIPVPIAKILRDYRDTTIIERKYRGTVELFAARTDKFIKMFTRKENEEVQEVGLASISRDLHSAINMYNKTNGKHMDVSGPDIYLAGRLYEAKQICDEFGNITDDEIEYLFATEKKLSKRQILRIRYNLKEYLIFAE